MSTGVLHTPRAISRPTTATPAATTAAAAPPAHSRAASTEYVRRDEASVAGAEYGSEGCMGSLPVPGARVSATVAPSRTADGANDARPSGAALCRAAVPDVQMPEPGVEVVH